MLEVARELKKRGAKHIIANTTFPLFTSGLTKFDEAVAEGTLTTVVGTNLTYRTPELLKRDWYLDVDCSKYTAYFVAAINHDMLLKRDWYLDVDCSKYTAYFVAAINHDISVSSICDPIQKIEALLATRK